MERLEKKVIKGIGYYYYTKWEWSNGKCRRVWQKYLGKLEDIVKAVEGKSAGPLFADIFQFGLPSVLWNECTHADLIGRIDALCPKRDQGLSMGQYIAIAAINRAIDPMSKSSIHEWFSKTVLLRHIPDASREALSSQRFWDNLDRLDPQACLSIWQGILKEVIRREGIDISSVCYDGTNFYTFIDTFNCRCSLAKRGKNKQGRSNLRQVSYALFCSPDGEIPLYYDLYEGNRNDTQQFPLMIGKFDAFLKEVNGKQTEKPQVTIIFDKGNNSKGNFELIDELQIHYVGSIKLSEAKDLAERSNKDPLFTGCQTVGLESTKACRVKRKIYGKDRTVVVTYNQNLFHTQWLTVHNDIKKAVDQLQPLQQRLQDRADGLIKGGKCPTIASVEKQCKAILSRQYMQEVIRYCVSDGPDGIPHLDYEIDNEAISRIADTYLGKNLIVTDRESWSHEEIILAYRSQFHIENVFREIKDREIGSWWPLYHWTDQKIKVHAFYCTIAILLRALAYRRVTKAGVRISMKRLIEELSEIREVILFYPRKKGKREQPVQTVLSKTSELQESLLSILHLRDQNEKLG
jgi:transposase